MPCNQQHKEDPCLKDYILPVTGTADSHLKALFLFIIYPVHPPHTNSIPAEFLTTGPAGSTPLRLSKDTFLI
jgi:hypothetical protein